MVGSADGWQSYFIDSLFLLSLFCFYFHLFTCLLIEERRIIGSKSGNCDSSISLSISFVLFSLLFFADNGEEGGSVAGVRQVAIVIH